MYAHIVLGQKLSKSPPDYICFWPKGDLKIAALILRGVSALWEAAVRFVARCGLTKCVHQAEGRRKMNNFQNKVGFMLLLVVALIGGAIAQTGDEFKHTIIAPGDLKWVDLPTGQGQQRAVLFGDPAKTGPYTIRMKFPANTAIRPHSHPDDRQVTLLYGTLYLGQGNISDREKSAKVLPGTFFTEPRRVVHYGFTGTEEVITQVSGIGPTSTDYAK